MVDAISQPGCAECGAGGLVLTDYRPYAFLRALLRVRNRCGSRTTKFTHESGRVVILDRFGVAEGLEDRIGLQELLLQLALKV